MATLLLASLVAVPATAIDVPFDPLPIPGEDACNNLDAPIPASPHGFGSFVVKLDIDRAGRSADPFADEHPASIESVYGTSPQWFTYDNGCTGQFVAEAGTALSNILLELAGLLPNWSHALLHSVLSPSSWLIALEEPVVEATTATARGVWSPWLPIVLLLVVVIIILRSRAGRFASSATAAAWALLVLGLSSWLMNYPLEAVHLVDDGVRGGTELIATSFNDDKAPPEDAEDLGDESAVVAVDIQFDHIVRTTQYRTWPLESSVILTRRPLRSTGRRSSPQPTSPGTSTRPTGMTLRTPGRRSSRRRPTTSRRTPSRSRRTMRWRTTTSKAAIGHSESRHHW
ncbi:serine/arginine repetitive matrix protein 2 [Nocardioidaceae bacterium Broad-1]|nr:serine/arginine repetitive matrix protein 2 [Nocardioidaceae bacterium Broad-1]